MTYATWLADVLRDAGLTVVEHPGWKTRGHRDFTGLRGVVWHHDASAKGPSPFVPTYMIEHWNQAAAQCWIALDGTWHLIAAGVAWHAGAVYSGCLSNDDSIGIETDHTTGEGWSGVFLLASLRRGTAAILRHLGRSPATGMDFHRYIARPKGRKSDPDALDIAEERAAVALIMAHPEEDDVTPELAARLNQLEAAVKTLQTESAAQGRYGEIRDLVKALTTAEANRYAAYWPVLTTALAQVQATHAAVLVDKGLSKEDAETIAAQVVSELAGHFDAEVIVTPKESTP